MPLHPRPEVEKLEMCPHGGPNYAELERLGFTPEDVLDFSVSANPFGPPPGIEEVLKSAVIDRYPDSDSVELRRALVNNIDIDIENIIVGNGSMELIRTVALAYLGKDDVALIIEPTFGEYEVACEIAGAKIIKCQMQEDNGFSIKSNDLTDSIQRDRPKVVFLCNPNNPTGQYLKRETIEQILFTCEDTLLILDEAYINFTENPWRSLDLIDQHNLVILRSMTKDYALAGLRLGYAIANSEIINTLKKVCPPWNVNAVAQRAGIIAIEDTIYLRRCQEDIRKARDLLRQELINLALSPLPSQTHFFLVKVGNATQFRRELLQYGIMVRDCGSFGLPEYIRIATRSSPDCERLIEAIKKNRE